MPDKEILFQKSWIDRVRRNLGKESADKLSLMILRYALYDELPSDEELLKEGFAYTFYMVKEGIIDEERKRKRGGAPKGNKNACKKKPKARAKRGKRISPKAQKASETVEAITSQAPYNPRKAHFGES